MNSLGLQAGDQKAHTSLLPAVRRPKGDERRGKEGGRSYPPA